MTRIVTTSGLIVLALGGCALTDPYLREGSWRPLGVNDANLVQMVANPSDLVSGTASATGSDGHLAAAAIDRLRRDKVKSLGDTLVGSVKPVSSGAPAAAATGAN